MKSLFTPFKKEGLTTLKIRYDFKTDLFKLYAAKEWEKDFDFSQYNKSFSLDGIFTENAKYFNTIEVRELYRKYDLEGYLDQVLDLVRQGKHFGIDIFYHHKYDIKFMMHEHSRKLGLNNRSAAIMAGGIRRHSPEVDELEVIIDGLNLGRGMSFKTVAANLPFGGAKATVQMEALDMDNMEIMGFLGFAVDSTRDLTAPDMNFPPEMSDVMLETGYSVQYTGGPKSKTGPTGTPTAYGVYLSMKQAVKFQEGTESLDNKSVLVVGLGTVGYYICEYLLQEDVKLYIADIDLDPCNKLIQNYPNRDITIVDVDSAYTMDVDILCPCAIGGIFHDDNIPELRCKYIWGSANNQLKASSQEEEYRLARLIADQGILFQTEWWHNTAGVICATEEFLYDGTIETLNKKVEEIIPVNTWNNLNKAKRLNITPTEAAYETCDKVIYG